MGKLSWLPAATVQVPRELHARLAAVGDRLTSYDANQPVS
jgi:hypothetical protein